MTKIMRGLLLFGAAGVLLLAGGCWVMSGWSACSGADDRLGEQLAKESVLAAPGDEFRREELTVHRCDEDDAHVEVEGRYRRHGTDAAAAYAAVLRREGWRPLDLEWPTRHCWVKDTGGTTAYLHIQPVSGAELYVYATADRQRGDWC